jgi:pimeloyl-ACP methyl ester carboxylesterase
MAPVVLVHGFLATPALMLPMRRRLAAAGRAVFQPDLSFLCVQDVRQLARELDASVERVRSDTGADRVDVVGVSQGGILSLWWAHHLGGWDRARRVVLVGSPVRGTWAAAVGLPLLGPVSRGIWQLLPGSGFLPELARPLPPTARVTTLSMRGDPVCPSHRCVVEGADNRVLDGSLGPLQHQYLALSRRVAREIGSALDAP